MRTVIALALVAIFWIAPFFAARRVGRPKGLRWFWWALFLGWVGVLVLSLRRPKPWAADTPGSSYHVPPGYSRARR